MLLSKADIVSQLQKDILSLQGFKQISHNHIDDFGLGQIEYAFPDNRFPVGVVHELIYNKAEDAAATDGFMAGILSSLMRNDGVILWIGSLRTIFPTALKAFGITPDKIIFIDLQKEKEILWAMEEGLKCEGLAAVVGEMQELSFTNSRRLQLAVEQSRVTGFVLRRNPRKINTTACVTRWKISSLPSLSDENMPGVGFPRWNVELLKVRNGKPGSWEIEWKAGKFRIEQKVAATQQEQQKKTG